MLILTPTRARSFGVMLAATLQEADKGDTTTLDVTRWRSWPAARSSCIWTIHRR